MHKGSLHPSSRAVTGLLPAFLFVVLAWPSHETLCTPKAVSAALVQWQRHGGSRFVQVGAGSTKPRNAIKQHDAESLPQTKELSWKHGSDMCRWCRLWVETESHVEALRAIVEKVETAACLQMARFPFLPPLASARCMMMMHRIYFTAFHTHAPDLQRTGRNTQFS